MLREIYAENFALIDRLRQEFDTGLSVLTGETGAGKSVLIDAVGLLLGDRFEQGFIRAGSDKCLVEGIFEAPHPPAALRVLNEAGLEQSNEEPIIISREGRRDGKGIARINYRTVPLALLKELAANLINIHGQAEHTLLCDEDKQAELLDCCGEEELLRLRAQTADAWTKYRRSLNALEAEKQKIAAAKEKEDFLRYQLKELKAASLQPGEDDRLSLEAQKLGNSERLLAYSAEAHEELKGSRGVLERLDNVLNAIRRLSNMDSSMNEYAATAESLYYEAEDLASVLGNYADSIDSEPQHIEAVQRRLAELERLKKKYHLDIAGLIQFQAQCEQELLSIDTADELLNEQKLLVEQALSEYMQIASALSEARQATAERLSAQISNELQELYMPNSQFKVELLPCPPSEHGLEKIRFMLAANIGEPFAPLAKTASGGELSRVILAIKVIMTDADNIPTLIFDEIDTGLGGRAVSAVSKKLSLLAEHKQVLCVTHAPILAAAAEHQIYIFKKTEGERTLIHAEELKGEARVKELCRMLAGDVITEQTIAQAEQMLKK